MALPLIKIEKMIDSLIMPDSWDTSSLEASTESYFRQAMRTQVSAVYRSDICLTYHIGLKKEIDPEFTECLIFLIRLADNMPFEIVDKLIDDMRHTVLKVGLTRQPHFIFFIGENKHQEEVINDGFWGGIFLYADDLRNLLSRTYLLRNILDTLKGHALKMSGCPFHYLGPCNPDMFVGRKRLIS